MLKFDDNLKEANLSEVKKNRKDKMKVVLATGMALVTFCSGCAQSEVIPSKATNPPTSETGVSEETNKYQAYSKAVIYLVTDNQAVLFDDSCIINDNGYSLYETNMVSIGWDNDFDKLYDGSIIVDPSSLTFVCMPDAYTVAENMAHEMVGEDGIVIDYKDYFENMREDGKSRK